MEGISSEAAGSMENKHKYNSIELNNSLDLNIYDAFYRNLDIQTGRWWQIDPKLENQEAASPYTSMANDPILKNDPLGDEEEASGGPGPVGTIELGKELAGIIRLIRSGENISNATKGLTFEKVYESISFVSDGVDKVASLQKIINNEKAQSISAGASLTIDIAKDIYRQDAVKNSMGFALLKMEGLQNGGGKNAQHANQKAREAAEIKYNEAKKNYNELKSKPNKTKEDKEALNKAEKAMKREKKKMDNTGENHSRKAKGSN